MHVLQPDCRSPALQRHWRICGCCQLWRRGLVADRRVVKRKNGEDWELGSGNFGKVMRGIRGDVQPVAIKSAFKRDRKMEEDFIREIAMMK